MFLKDISVPIIIKKINVIERNGKLYLGCVSEDGVCGYMEANNRVPFLLPIFKEMVIPYFTGKDARNLEELIENVYTYKRNYKYAGMPFWNCVGHVEASILDMVGKTVGKPVGELLGNLVRKEVPVYLSRFNRHQEPEEEIEQLIPLVEKHSFKAVKFKIGGRMSKNADVYPGYSEKLVKLARKALGDDIVIYVDANGSYFPEKAIEVGKMLEEYNIGFYEEPCPWEDFMGTAKVNQKLNIPVAGGEQDTSLYKFQWMIANEAVSIVQPDLMYNGGIIRCLKVAEMAEKAGLKIAPHNPKTGQASAPLLHLISIISNPAPYHEYKEADEVVNGKVRVPDIPGLGFELDIDLAKARIVL
ncbi:MAG: mandelate racemase/muconate lactonizing enzyme family protein [Halanaerobiales bacterium]